MSFNENYIGSVKQMSIYRVSDAPPNWAQDDPSQPDYIKNKPELVAGENIVLTKRGNKVIISAVEEGTDPDIPDIPDVPDTPDEPDIPDIPSEEGTVVDIIIEGKIPVYIENDGKEDEQEFVILENPTSYKEEGFYVFIDNGEITNAGYQVIFEESKDEIAQSILIPKGAKIINTYQYQPSLGQWTSMGTDETYWVAREMIIKTVNGEEIEYIRYTYNSELWGEPIMTEEYWRFEMEVQEWQD